MRATDYLEKHKSNIQHYNEIKQTIYDTKEHRDNFGKIFEYCHKNLATIQKIQSELLPILNADETYCVFFHLLHSDLERENTASTPYLVDESNVTERYYANLVKEQENDNLYTFDWWREVEQQAKRAIEQENRNSELAIPDNLLKSLQAKNFIENADIFPFNWQGTLKELHYFINKYFPNEPNKWEKTVNFFVWNGTKINKKSLSTAITKYDNEPERGIIIDNL